MTPNDKPQFVAVLVGLAQIKPGKGLTPEALELWWNAMQAWSLEEFKAAATHLASSHEFMPSPFHFEQLRKAGRKTAHEAWLEVLDYVRKGYSRWDFGGVFERQDKPAAPDASSQRAAECLGGYKAIAMCDEDKLHFMARQFSQVYTDQQDAIDVRHAIPMLAAPGESLRIKHDG